MFRLSDLEHYTVSLNHNVEQSTFGYTASAQDMKGWLQVNEHTDAAHQLCMDDSTAVHMYNSASPFGFNGTGGSTDSSPCMISPKQDAMGVDYFEVGTLLTAAGLDIDDIQQSKQRQLFASLCCV